MSRLTVVIYPNGRTMLVAEDQLSQRAASELQEAWREALDKGVLTIIPDATVKLIEAEFVDGGIQVPK